jgi:hypothetical protein
LYEETQILVSEFKNFLAWGSLFKLSLVRKGYAHGISKVILVYPLLAK